MPAARLLAMAIAASAMAMGCSSSPKAIAPTTTATASTSEATTTTEVASTTTSPGPTMFFPTPTAAITYLVGAWSQNDSKSALKVANAQAVINLFTQPEQGFALYGCDSGEFSTSNCNYRNRSTGGYAQIEAEKLPKGWVILSVNMDTDG